ncbi:NCS2 family permease [Mycoplasma sp. P36-A1]|uniref:NCS2 family permease n=1 Tax=Mycoplasma sp. P36-A1 TaxID=3252900 RepID=UPI003C2D7C34
MNRFTQKLDAFFGVTKSGSSFKKELIGGISAYLAMAYIIFVNPSVLGDAGMDHDAVFASTIFGAATATLIMGLYAKFPLGLASCMSMNAFFAYSVVLGTGLSWQEALSCVLVSSVIFLALSYSGIRFKILEAIPEVLKNAGSVGLGLFIAFIGMKNSHIIISDPSTMIKIGDFSDPNFIIAGCGIIFLAILLTKKNKNAVIFSMIFAMVVGLLLGVLNSNGLIHFTEEQAATLPHLSGNLIALPTTPINAMMSQTFGVAFINIPKIMTVSGITIVLTFTFLDFFGTAATLNAATSEMRNFNIDTSENKRIYVSDALGSFFGSIFGTSNITTYIESVSGIVQGARTGLMAVVVAILFLLSLFLHPFLSLFTSAVTAPALVAIGIFMFKNVSTIQWQNNFEETIPAFLTIVLMPLTGSIALGLTIGFVFHTILMVAAKRKNEVHTYMYYVTIVSIIYIASVALS